MEDVKADIKDVKADIKDVRGEIKFKGLDMGTSKIVLATETSEAEEWPDYQTQLNAFVSLPFSNMTEATLKEESILHEVQGSRILAFGNRCDEFANMLGGTPRRPMYSGLLNPAEPLNLEVIGLIAKHLCGPAKKGEKICFSSPSSPDGTDNDLVYHEESLREILEDLGYQVTSINEGLAVVFAELSDNDLTGFGMSFGGGLCNVCFAYLGIPVMNFCTAFAGDYIDQKAAAAIGETETTVRLQKESDDFTLSGRSSNRADRALVIYYRDVIRKMTKALKQQLDASKRLPRLTMPVPVVFAGGTAKVKGFQAMLKDAIKDADLPIQISDVKPARSGANATAKGSLLAARMNM